MLLEQFVYVLLKMMGIFGPGFDCGILLEDLITNFIILRNLYSSVSILF